MALKSTLFRAWSIAVSAAASECVNATLNVAWGEGRDSVLGDGGTAVDAKGNAWVTSFDRTATLVIWKCLEDGECVSKSTGEFMPLFLGSHEIAVHASGDVSIVYLLLHRVEGPDDVRKCIWDDNSHEDISCSQFFENGADSKFNYHLALDKEGNVFLPYGTISHRLQKCSPAGDCVDFGGDFWNSHGFAPNHVAFDLQGNLYVTRLPGITSAGDTLVAKCTSIGECTETQITVPPAHANAHFGYDEIALGPDDNIYMMVADGTLLDPYLAFNQWLIQCSLDGVCNQVMTFDHDMFMKGLSVGKHDDLYTVRVPQQADSLDHADLLRLCVPPQINEIQV